MAGLWQRSQIQNSVQALLQLAQVTQAPIPIEKIARLCGAKLRYVPFEGDLSGLLFQVEEQIIIGSMPFTRRHDNGLPLLTNWASPLHSHDRFTWTAIFVSSGEMNGPLKRLIASRSRPMPLQQNSLCQLRC